VSVDCGDGGDGGGRHDRAVATGGIMRVRSSRMRIRRSGKGGQTHFLAVRPLFLFLILCVLRLAESQNLAQLCLPARPDSKSQITHTAGHQQQRQQQQQQQQQLQVKQTQQLSPTSP
jgi:hypothetical protein